MCLMGIINGVVPMMAGGILFGVYYKINPANCCLENDGICNTNSELDEARADLGEDYFEPY